MLKVLVVDDDATLRLAIRKVLEAASYSVDEAPNGERALDMFSNQGPYHAVFLDVNMPRLSGIDTLQKIKEVSPETFCVVLTAYSNVQDAKNAIKYGAFDYIEKPVESDRILNMMESAKQASSLVEAAAFSAPQVKFDEGRNMIGESSSIRMVFGLIHKLSKVETSVLIRGESGTGKELVARALHFNSPRKKGSFVAVNCGAIPDNLIESELFGHEKGAFTGADKKKIGKFQFAEGGTIFLDEIGDISQQMQVKLLRVLQEKVFTPVGSNQDVKVDVRIIAATNKPLEEMIAKNTFRADLFYRLNILPIMLPPLRDRRDDIATLVTFMIKKFNRSHGRTIAGIVPDALEALRHYPWPGNIRELENVIEHAFIIESSDEIGLGSIPAHVTMNAPSLPTGASGSGGPVASAPINGAISQAGHDDVIFGAQAELKYPVLKERFEREFIIRALKAFNGRINQTAEKTQMTKVTLLRKLEKYQINPKEYQV